MHKLRPHSAPLNTAPKRRIRAPTELRGRQSSGGARRSAGSGCRFVRRRHAGRDRVAPRLAVPVVGQARRHVLHGRVCHLPPATCSRPAAAARVVAQRPGPAPSSTSRRGGMSLELRHEQQECIAASQPFTMRAILCINASLQSLGSPRKSVGSQSSWFAHSGLSVRCLLQCMPVHAARRCRPGAPPCPAAAGCSGCPRGGPSARAQTPGRAGPVPGLWS